jgi:hypothetical protein
MENSTPHVMITSEMISRAKDLIPSTKVNRTVASDIDTLTGHLGEFAFAQFFYGDWGKNRVGENKGDVNFKDIEIKTSAFPFNKNLNLLVREDYAKKRKPPFYIQIIIDVDDPKANEIKDGTRAYICGFATAVDVDNAPLRDFGSKFGGRGGYRCHYINIQNLKPMNTFEEHYKKQK